jgi:hypothetical protein
MCWTYCLDLENYDTNSANRYWFCCSHSSLNSTGVSLQSEVCRYSCWWSRALDWYLCDTNGKHNAMAPIHGLAAPWFSDLRSRRPCNQKRKTNDGPTRTTASTKTATTLTSVAWGADPLARVKRVPGKSLGY